MKPLALSLAGAAAAAALIASAIPPAVHAQAYAGQPVDANAVVADPGDWTLKDRDRWPFSHTGQGAGTPRSTSLVNGSGLRTASRDRA